MERVCLECASPLNRCGHCYFSLRRDDVSKSTAWRITAHPCTCGLCAEQVDVSLSGGADGVVTDRRARLAQRHNTEQLDAILGVDEPLVLQRVFVENRVPVLLLRRMLLRDKKANYAPTMVTMPLVGYHRTDVLPFIFCSFRRTLAFMRTERGRDLFQQRVLERCSELEERFQIDVPAQLIHDGRSCLIVAAALLRVVVAYDMIHEVRTNTRYAYTLDAHVQYYEYNLQLFIDTHLDLLLAVDVGGTYDDVSLCEPMSARTAMPAEALSSNAPVAEILRRSVFERAYPHPLRAPAAGQLADMTNATFDADFFTKTSDNTLSKVSELIHNIQSKTANHRCAGRNFSKMLCEMWGYNSPSLTFVQNILEVHSLGNYPGVLFRPGLRTRLAVRRSYSMDELQSEPWCAWCHYNDMVLCPNPGCDNCASAKRPKPHKKHICPMCNEFANIQPKLIAAVREFSVYMVHSHLIIDFIMRIDAEWTAYTNVVGLAANESRSHLHRMYRQRVAHHARDLEFEHMCAMRDVELAHACNKSVQRLRKDYKFAELMHRMCKHAHTKEVVCETWSGLQSPEDFLEAPLHRANMPFLDPRLRRMNDCFAPLAHLGNRRWCEVFTLAQVDGVAQTMLNKAGDIVVSMLHLIGVSPACLTAVLELYVNSELRNMPDNSFKAACIQLYLMFPVDFHIIHYLLRRICHHDKFRIALLDDNTARAQVRALRARHKVADWDELPPAVGRLYFCDGDWRVYADVVEPFTDDLVQHTVDKCDGDAIYCTHAAFGSGPKGALYCHESGKLFCTRPSSSSIAKKFERDGMMAESEFFGDADGKGTDVDKRTAKSIRVAQHAVRACARPLKYVDLIGRMVRIGSHIYARCVTCAAVFAVQNNSLANRGGFTCGRHLQIADATCYSELREFVSRHSHEIMTRTNDALANGCQVVPLIDHFVTHDKGVESTHVRINRKAQLLCAPANVKSKSTPLDKLFSIGTPCFAEEKFKSNIELLSWAAQLGDQIMSTRVIARRFGVLPTVSIAAETLNERPLAEQVADVHSEKAALEERRVLYTADDFVEQQMALDARLSEVNERIADATRIAEAAAAAVEAAESAEDTSGLSLAEAERMSDEAIASGACLQRLAITCAFCYNRCERHGAYTRVNVIDVDGLFVEPLWQRKITTLGRLDIWLCKTDFARVEHFLGSHTIVMASDLWDALVEMKKRSFARRVAFQQGGGK